MQSFAGTLPTAVVQELTLPEGDSRLQTGPTVANTAMGQGGKAKGKNTDAATKQLVKACMDLGLREKDRSYAEPLKSVAGFTPRGTGVDTASRTLMRQSLARASVY